ncbi:MAG: TfoX/Sxy family protein [Thermomicrobiales bacterium]
MARDAGLEEVVRDELGDLPGLTGKAMFGGWCWMLNGHLLCGANHDGVMVRLGKGNDAWALELDGITPMAAGTRVMPGWVRVSPERFADHDLARRLLADAQRVVASLPPKT